MQAGAGASARSFDLNFDFFKLFSIAVNEIHVRVQRSQTHTRRYGYSPELASRADKTALNGRARTYADERIEKAASKVFHFSLPIALALSINLQVVRLHRRRFQLHTRTRARSLGELSTTTTIPLCALRAIFTR